MGITEEDLKKLGVKVYPNFNPDPFLSGNNWSHVPDRADNQMSKVMSAQGGRPAFDYSTSTPEQAAAYKAFYGVDTPAEKPEKPSVNDRWGTGGYGYGSGPSYSEKLSRDKWEADQVLARRVLEGYQNRLTSGSYMDGINELLKLISNREATSKQAITDNYNLGMSNINSGYDTAKSLSDRGYADVNAYLNKNRTNPYASLTQNYTPVTNAMGDYLNAYGVSNDPVDRQVQATNAAGQQGADSFNQLARLLSSAQSGDAQSRLDEMRMAQLMSDTGIGQARAAYGGNAAAAQQQSLNALADQIAELTFNTTKAGNDMKTALENKIIESGGVVGGSMAPPSIAPNSARARRDAVADAVNQYPNFKAALKDLNPKYKFTTMAAAKKAFPALAAAFR